MELNRYSLKVQGYWADVVPPMLSGFWKNDPFSPEEESRLITTQFHVCFISFKITIYEEFRLLLTHCNIIYNHLSIIFDKSLISSLLQ